MDYFWIWISVLVISIIIEAITEQFISIWFAPAALISAILDICNIDFVFQCVAFLVVALVGVLIARKIFKKFIPSKDTRTNIEAIIGESCVVTERIDNFAGCGQAKVHGQIWSARGVSNDDVFEVGEVLKIVAIEGVKIICKKI